MKWIHVIEQRPERGRKIITISHPFDSNGKGDLHYTIGMGAYDVDWEVLGDYKKHMKSEGWQAQWWWMYAEDFPFPEECKEATKFNKEIEDAWEIEGVSFCKDYFVNKNKDVLPKE